MLQWLNEHEVEEYMKTKFESARYKINTYQVFMERGVGLLRDAGKLGYITPTSYLRNKFALGLRAFLLKTVCVDVVRVFGYPVFRKVSEDTCITILTKECADPESHEVSVVHSGRLGGVDRSFFVSQSSWSEDPDKNFGVGGDNASRELADWIESRSLRLGDFATAYFGIQTRDRNKYVAGTPRTSKYKAVIDGAHIEPYGTPKAEEFVDFQPKAIKSGGNPSVYAQARIGIRQIGETPIGTLLPPNLLTLNTIYNIYFTRPTRYDLRFVLAVLCSEPFRWHWRQTQFDQKKVFPKIKKDSLLNSPIPRIDFNDRKQSGKHDAIVKLVDGAISAKLRLSKARVSVEKATLRRRFDNLIRQLDDSVADLWQLRPDQRAQMKRGN
jgi:hypothetical protein